MNRWWFIWITCMIGGLAAHVYGYADGLFVMAGQAITAGIVCILLDAVHDRRRSRR